MRFVLPAWFEKLTLFCTEEQQVDACAAFVFTCSQPNRDNYIVLFNTTFSSPSWLGSVMIMRVELRAKGLWVLACDCAHSNEFQSAYDAKV